MTKSGKSISFLCTPKLCRLIRRRCYMFVGGPVPVLLNLVIVGAILALGSDRKAGLLIVEQGPVGWWNS